MQKVKFIPFFRVDAQTQVFHAMFGLDGGLQVRAQLLCYTWSGVEHNVHIDATIIGTSRMQAKVQCEGIALGGIKAANDTCPLERSHVPHDIPDIPPEIEGLLRKLGIMPLTRDEVNGRILSGFEDLLRMPLEHEFIRELKRWGSGVELKLSSPPRIESLNHERILRLLQSSDPPKVEEAYFQMMQRVSKETSYLEELEDSGIADSLRSGFVGERYQALVKFVEEGSIIGKRLSKDGVRGCYFPHLDTCLILGKRPSLAETWAHMAANGTLPDVVAVLDHELTHDAQYTLGQHIMLHIPPIVQFGTLLSIGRAYGLLSQIVFQISSMPLVRKCRDFFSNMNLLSEMHAYSAAARSPGYAEKHLDEPAEIILGVLIACGYPPEYVIPASRAFSGLLSLNLLGLSDSEIGRVVSLCKVDAKTGTFPKLEEAITERRKELGLEDDQAFDCVCRCALARQLISRQEGIAAAQRIALEEFEKLLDDSKSSTN